MNFRLFFKYLIKNSVLCSVLYKQSSLTDEPTLFFDPNTLSTDGTIALSGKAFSEDGSLLAYGLSESGSDWIKIKIRNVESGEDYPDLLERVKFSAMTWTHDNKGLFYCVSLNLEKNDWPNRIYVDLIPISSVILTKRAKPMARRR